MKEESNGVQFFLRRDRLGPVTYFHMQQRCENMCAWHLFRNWQCDALYLWQKKLCHVPNFAIFRSTTMAYFEKVLTFEELSDISLVKTFAATFSLAVVCEVEYNCRENLFLYVTYSKCVVSSTFKATDQRSFIQNVAEIGRSWKNLNEFDVWRKITDWARKTVALLQQASNPKAFFDDRKIHSSRRNFSRMAS